MNRINLNKQKMIKNEETIKILSLVGIVGKTISIFCYIAWVITLNIGINIFDYVVQTLVFSFFPFFLITVFMLFLYKRIRENILISIISGALAAFSLLSILVNQHLSLTNLIIFVVFLLVALVPKKGLSKKIFLIVATCLGFIVLSWECLSFFSYQLFVMIGNFCEIIGYASFSASLILFILHEGKEKDRKNITVEQALIILKNKLELGTITEEEYQKYRAEIIKHI